MVFDVSIKNNISILQLEGRFDAYEVPEIDTWFEENASGNPFVIIDLQKVTFIDTRALSTLVKWMKKLRENGGDLKLIQFSNPVRVIFELSRLDKAFSIYATLTDALADCEGTTSNPVDEATETDLAKSTLDTDGIHMITLSKRVDAFRIPELQEKYGDFITEDQPYAIIDLSTVEFLDSAALAWLVKVLKQTQAHQGELVLVRSKIDTANRIFQLTQFDKVFKFAGSIDEALAIIV